MAWHEVPPSLPPSLLTMPEPRQTPFFALQAKGEPQGGKGAEHGQAEEEDAEEG